MKRWLSLLVVIVALVTRAACGQEPPKYFEQVVADSDPLRVAQAKELEAYVQAMKRDDSALRMILRPDYANPQAFEASVQPYRAGSAGTSPRGG